MACLCDAVLAGGAKPLKTVPGKSLLHTNQILFPPAPHSYRNGILSITLSHMEQIPRGLCTIQQRGTLLWSGSQARLTLETHRLKLWGFSGAKWSCWCTSSILSSSTSASLKASDSQIHGQLCSKPRFAFSSWCCVY